jgi:hypothetical protein
MVTPQQLVYACAFSNQRAGSIVGHLLDFHSATIKSSSGTVLAQVNTKVSKIMFQAKIKSAASQTTVGTAKALQNRALSASRSVSVTGNRALAATRSVSFIGVGAVKFGSQAMLVPATDWFHRQLKIMSKVFQAVLFTPLALFIWVPIHFIEHNYSQRLGMILCGVILYAIMMVFPFVFFQGTPQVGEMVVVIHVGLVLSFCVVGVYNNRLNPALLVVDGPKQRVRASLRSVLAYLTLALEFWQIPLLAVTASHLVDRYATSKSSGPTEWDIFDITVRWSMDDLFSVQYPLAVISVACWSAIFCVAQSFAIVYRKSFDAIIGKVQLAIFLLSGPGYLFTVKNLMKPLFCITKDGASVVAADARIMCWSPMHLNYCTISLFCLALFCPSATLCDQTRGFVCHTISNGESVSCGGFSRQGRLTDPSEIFGPGRTNAIKFSESEDVRFVYLFLRLELLMKGVMVFLALSYQGDEVVRWAHACACA